MDADGVSPRWLILVHQLPAKPSKLRVQAWRRLQAVGAVLVKNSVYFLPNSRETREEFEWIRNEIVARGGEAVVFTADAVDELTSKEVVEAFVAARRSDWDELRERAAALTERPGAHPGDEHWEREVKALRNRAAQIDKIDYFRSPGRQEAMSAIDAAESTLRPSEDATSEPSRSVDGYRGRRWLTRPRPGVDRMASAWLIRRFVDPDAEFLFADRISPGQDLVPFDMFGVELGHHGERCTFETLLRTFALAEPPLERIGRIVHDLDLRSESVDSETMTVSRLVDGLRQAFADDSTLLERGMDVFEALYRSFRSES